MIRARFKANYPDYRPINWPIKHPYWCSGYDMGGSHSTIVAYADNVEEIQRNWPEAKDIDVMEDGVTEYTFTTRFPKPDWFKEPA